jgi:dihydrolipoamide dehydrogenase
MDNILLGIDDEARDEIIKALKKLGVKIVLNKKISSAVELFEEKILVAVGRKAAQINIPYGDNVYLAGDVLKGTPQYAHTAEKEGYAAAIKAIKGENISIDYNLNPACIYSNPEYAFIGEPLKSLESADVDEFKADYSASGMATVYLETKGFMKVFAEKQTGKIKSAHLLGHNAVELISAFIPAINKGITLEEIKSYIYPHPTFCESIRKLRKV